MKNPFTDRLTVFLKRRGAHTQAVIAYWNTQANNPGVFLDKIPIDTINSFSWSNNRCNIEWCDLHREYSSKCYDKENNDYTLYDLVD